jgi:hypothetical protein
MSTVETVADQLVRDLARMGVQRIYGLVGDSLNPISDAVRRAGPADRGGIDRVHVHNEEAARLVIVSLLRGRQPASSRPPVPPRLGLPGIPDGH